MFELRRWWLWLLLLTVACCAKPTAPTPGPVRQGVSKPEPVKLVADTRPLLERPHVTLLVVTDWQATLKPCGCTVDLQKGGIERITKWVTDARVADPSLLVVHAGSLLFDAESQSSPAKQAQLLLRRQMFVQGLGRLGLAAAALSGWDLQQGGSEVEKTYADAAFDLTALGYRGALEKVVPALLKTTSSGVKVGLLGTDPAWLPTDVPAQAKLVQQAVTDLHKQGAQAIVVLSNLGLRATRKLIREIKGIDAVVIGQLDEKVEPLTDLDREGDTLILHAARHGAWFTAATLIPESGNGPWTEASEYLPSAVKDLQGRRDALAQRLQQARERSMAGVEQAMPFYQAQLHDFDQRIAAARAVAGKAPPAGRLVAYQAVGLDWSSPVDPATAEMVRSYDAKAAESAEKLAKEPVPPLPGQPRYVGQPACLDCHGEVHDFVAQDFHTQAWKTLEKVQKTKDLDCVACHMTGWGKPGGSAFGNLETFKSVQCEACHGPGSAHIADQQGKGPAAPLGKVTVATCKPCHSDVHSPRFAYDAYREHLLMPGHGKPQASKAPKK